MAVQRIRGRSLSAAPFVAGADDRAHAEAT